MREQATTTADGERDRTIAGVAYWFPHQGTVSTALLLDYEQVDYNDFAPSRPTSSGGRCTRWSISSDGSRRTARFDDTVAARGHR